MVDPAASTSVEIDVAKIVAVVDTNVLVEVHSVHDVTDARPRDEAKRWANARDSLLLAIHFHETRATTYSIHEIAEVMQARVPPTVRTPEGLFAGLVAHFVADRVLNGWNSAV